jgi:hypothetical protein
MTTAGTSVQPAYISSLLDLRLRTTNPPVGAVGGPRVGHVTNGKRMSMRQAKDLIDNFYPEKFPALAKLVEGKTEDELTALEQVVVLYANDFRAAAETAAAELARLQAIEAAARDMLRGLENNWDISELDADSMYETDLTGRVMQKLAAALTQPGDGDGAR